MVQLLLVSLSKIPPWRNTETEDRYDFMSDMAFGGGSELLSGEEEDRFWTVMEDKREMLWNAKLTLTIVKLCKYSISVAFRSTTRKSVADNLRVTCVIQRIYQRLSTIEQHATG